MYRSSGTTWYIFMMYRYDISWWHIAMTCVNDILPWHMRWHMWWHMFLTFFYLGKSYTVFNDIYNDIYNDISQWHIAMTYRNDACDDICFRHFSPSVNPTQFAMTYVMTYRNDISPWCIMMTYCNDICDDICFDDISRWHILGAFFDMSSCFVPMVSNHHICHQICHWGGVSSRPSSDMSLYMSLHVRICHCMSLWVSERPWWHIMMTYHDDISNLVHVLISICHHDMSSCRYVIVICHRDIFFTDADMASQRVSDEPQLSHVTHMWKIIDHMQN